jgi:hypothetical protein
MEQKTIRNLSPALVASAARSVVRPRREKLTPNTFGVRLF